MSFLVGPDGFFLSLNGHPVRKVDVRPKLRQIRAAQGKPGDGTTVYTQGYFTGFIFHWTQGYQVDISGSMYANGYATAGFCIGRDGSIIQFYPVDVAGWHAFSASHRYCGVEHEAYPGKTDLTDLQLGVSAEVMAALIEYVKQDHRYTIPVQHIPGGGLEPGFKDHKDGATTWNAQAPHSDGLYVWTWDKYLGVITEALRGDEMAYRDSKKGWRWAKAHPGEQPPADSNDDFLYGVAQRRFAEHAATLPEPGTPGKHTHLPADITAHPGWVT